MLTVFGIESLIIFCLFRLVAANITQFSENQTVTSPLSASFSCSASGLPRPNIMWLDPNSAVLMTGMDGVVISEEEDGERGITSTLNVTRTAPSLGGEYRCLADNGVTGRGDINTTSAILTVFGERSY